eukprot:235812-Chlamydomonas_euryale.AAC.2
MLKRLTGRTGHASPAAASAASLPPAEPPHEMRDDRRRRAPGRGTAPGCGRCTPTPAVRGPTQVTRCRGRRAKALLATKRPR